MLLCRSHPPAFGHPQTLSQTTMKAFHNPFSTGSRSYRCLPFTPNTPSPFSTAFFASQYVPPSSPLSHSTWHSRVYSSRIVSIFQAPPRPRGDESCRDCSFPGLGAELSPTPLFPIQQYIVSPSCVRFPPATLHGAIMPRSAIPVTRMLLDNSRALTPNVVCPKRVWPRKAGPNHCSKS